MLLLLFFIFIVLFFLAVRTSYVRLSNVREEDSHVICANNMGQLGYCNTVLGILLADRKRTVKLYNLRVKKFDRKKKPLAEVSIMVKNFPHLNIRSEDQNYANFWMMKI